MALSLTELNKKLDHDNRREFAELAAWQVAMESTKVDFIPEPNAIPPF